jgi:hypothetical protein
MEILITMIGGLLLAAMLVGAGWWLLGSLGEDEDEDIRKLIEKWRDGK